MGGPSRTAPTLSLARRFVHLLPVVAVAALSIVSVTLGYLWLTKPSGGQAPEVLYDGRAVNFSGPFVVNFTVPPGNLPPEFGGPYPTLPYYGVTIAIAMEPAYQVPNYGPCGQSSLENPPQWCNFSLCHNIPILSRPVVATGSVVGDSYPYAIGLLPDPYTLTVTLQYADAGRSYVGPFNIHVLIEDQGLLPYASPN
jgi:hypothetical protein